MSVFDEEDNQIISSLARTSIGFVALTVVLIVLAMVVSG
ncbi:MAG: hypothetical protein ACI82A_004381 [Candidatus Azotimanducaceae bacterium]|jgi:hypothetical protein